MPPAEQMHSNYYYFYLMVVYLIYDCIYYSNLSLSLNQRDHTFGLRFALVLEEVSSSYAHARLHNG